jgi:hypothetical protein
MRRRRPELNPLRKLSGGGGSAGSRCPCCGAEPATPHGNDCEVEQCPSCGGQLASCDCQRRPRRRERLPWAGVRPGVAECRELGWFARTVPGKGWVPCGPEEPGAAEDLNRLGVEARWDGKARRFAPKGPAAPAT